MSSSEGQVRAFVPGTVAGGGGGGRSDGFVTGYATGYAEGMRRATAAVTEREAVRDAAVAREQGLLRARVGDLMLTLRAGVVQLQADAEEQVDDVAAVVARCAAHLARQVVLEVAPTPEALLARLRRGLAAAPRTPGTTVSLSPAGVQTLERAGVLPDGLPGGVSVVADPGLGTGDVVVRAGATTVTDVLTVAVATALTTMCEETA